MHFLFLYSSVLPSLYYCLVFNITYSPINVPSVIKEEPFVTLQNNNNIYSTVVEEEPFVALQNNNNIYSTVIEEELFAVNECETFSLQQKNENIYSTNTIDLFSAQAIICSSEVVTVYYTTDIFVINSATVESVSSIFTMEFESTSTVETVSSIFTIEIESTSTVETVIESPFIVGDLEGFPTEIPVEIVPEVTIEEIPNTEVPEIRDNGLEFCQAVGLGDFIANGTQQQFQTCSLTVQGAIPDVDKMVSTLIISPVNNAVLTLGENFTIIIKSINIEYGFFDDPATLYYISPQRLNNEGIIQGHNHVAIQKLLGPGEVPSAKNPLFFKGLNDISADGTLSTEVNGKIFNETGEYRLCTSTASQGHQPVLNPVARRFFQDDCIRFTVVN